MVLHREIFTSLGIDSQADLNKLMDNIDNEDYRWLEIQAHAFAGHVLVPTPLLIQEVKSRGVTPEDLYPIFPELIEKFNSPAKYCSGGCRKRDW